MPPPSPCSPCRPRPQPTDGRCSATPTAASAWRCRTPGRTTWLPPASSPATAGSTSSGTWLPSTGLIQNRFSGKCLEVYAWSTYDFAAVVQWTCHGGRNQVWSWR
ncbi:RICIN domain-containing protein [Asanoa sp. NPDC049573]|uniref:RICIN domain-containing protein n=1 Tax=Asanoa sp. NPDC049573 TaxID=3155396 RepID=UPI003440CBF0